MLDPEIRAAIRRHYYAEHWKIGTIARQFGVHPDAVRRAIESERFHPAPVRQSIVDPFTAFLRQTLETYPDLRATRLHQMIAPRGYTGSVVQLRRTVARLRPTRREPFALLSAFPGEEAQADWACFGKVAVGRALRPLSCLAITLSYSRALYLEFFFGQGMDNFLLGHINAFQDWGGSPRRILYDNLRSAVGERLGERVHYNPRLVDLASHYHFEPLACRVRAANQKGRVERVIRYIRDSFWAGRSFTTLAECNRQALEWRGQVAHRRPCPADRSRTVAAVFQEEQAKLLSLPSNPFDASELIPVHSAKTIYIRFDRNDYSIPPAMVGRQLSLSASPSSVRILDGASEVARHVRTYDQGQVILDPAHGKELLLAKSRARLQTPPDHLMAAVPESAQLIELAFDRGESAGRMTSGLVQLLDLYGPAPLRRAVAEALKRNTPHISSIAFLLGRHHRDSQPRIRVDLSRYPGAADLAVRPHDLKTYDKLARPREDGDKSSE